MNQIYIIQDINGSVVGVYTDVEKALEHFEETFQSSIEWVREFLGEITVEEFFEEAEIVPALSVWTPDDSILDWFDEPQKARKELLKENK